MIHSVVSRFRRTSTHPLVVSLFAAVFAVSDPARSSILLGMYDTEGWLNRLRGRLLPRRAP